MIIWPHYFLSKLCTHQIFLGLPDWILLAVMKESTIFFFCIRFFCGTKIFRIVIRLRAYSAYRPVPIVPPVPPINTLLIRARNHMLEIKWRETMFWVVRTCTFQETTKRRLIFCMIFCTVLSILIDKGILLVSVS